MKDVWLCLKQTFEAKLLESNNLDTQVKAT